MNINKELTNKFYESYNPCNCGDCRFFIKNIENNQANIFKYLKSFNINPLKPYELVSIFNGKDKMIEYLDCVYVVFGTIDNEIETTIDGIKITSCNKERYPLLKTNDEYFLITFGPVYMNYSYTLNRHLTLDDKIQIIKKAIDEVDPMKLLAIDCSKDEYINEPTIEQSEKLFYSLDKTQRLIIFKNKAESYSYYIEKLIILDKYEAYFLKKNAYWEPHYVCTSFYENINDLLKDINTLIQGWTEK